MAKIEKLEDYIERTGSYYGQDKRFYDFGIEKQIGIMADKIDEIIELIKDNK